MKFRILPALLVLLFACGCMTVHKSSVFENIRVDDSRAPLCSIEIENTVWLLLNFIPLGSGDPEEPNVNTCRYFRNTVNLENNMKVLNREMAAAKTDSVANLTSHYADETYLFFLLARRSCHTSAVLLKPEEEARK